MCSASSAKHCVLPKGGPTPPKGTPASSFYRHKEGRCTCTEGHESHRLFPELRGCSGRALREVHCGVWRRAWQSPWASSLVLRRSRRRPASSSGRYGHCCAGGTVLQAWRGGVPRVLHARVLSWSRPESLPRVVPMPFGGSVEGKVRKRHGELAA